MTPPGRFLLAMVGALAGLGCAPEGPGRGPANGFILISSSALRADALGFQGRRPAVTPFLDALAAKAMVYERAYTISPDTLAAHVSLLSGLYPAEHRVVAPSGTLSADVPVLPELLADFGFRTAGFTSGGYLSADFGFDRGFDEFSVSRSGARSPFDRAARFLRGVNDERFFVFIHTDSIEEALMPRFDLRRLAAGNEPVTPDLSRSLEAEYLEAVSRLDRELERFFEEIGARGLLDRTVIAVTADHGFEWGEHGQVGHRQVYPETIGVPLIVLGPGLEPSRHRGLAQTVDIVPSFLMLAELPIPRLSGALLEGLPGQPAGREPRSWAVAQGSGRLEQKTLLLDRGGSSSQFVESRLRGEHDGTWVTREVTFDTRADELGFSIVSFGKRRTIRLASGGEVESEFEVGPKWSDVSLALSGGEGRKRLTLSADDCDSPTDLDGGPDRRCLSFKLRGQTLSRSELFDLGSDPGARTDISWDNPGHATRLRRELDETIWNDAPAPGATIPRAAALAAITARGENPEPPHP